MVRASDYNNNNNNIIIISLFNEDDILSYRLSNIWSSTMKLVQICLKHIYNTINTHYLHFKDVE